MCYKNIILFLGDRNEAENDFENTLLVQLTKNIYQGFGSTFFFADPDPDPGKNLHADPDPGGIRGRELGVKGKMIFFF